MEKTGAANASFERIIANLPPESSLAIPLLRDFSSPPGLVLSKRLERRYRRLCFVQKELKSINEKSVEANPADSSVSFEDFVFSKIDFSRYAKIPEKDFVFYSESVEDFSDDFFRKNFNFSQPEAKALIDREYRKIDTFYCLPRPNPVILSLMRTLDSSLESLPLVQEEEILSEMNKLYSFLNSARFKPNDNSEQKQREEISSELMRPFFDFLLKRLDGLLITNQDESQTKLFLNKQECLAGTFTPLGKPWTLTLVESKA